MYRLVALLVFLLLYFFENVEVEAFAAPSNSCQKRTTRRDVSVCMKKNKDSSPNNHASEERRQRSLRRGNMPLLSLNLNLDSLAKMKSKGAAPRAQELLQRIEALHREGYYGAAPDAVSYNSVLNAWARDQHDEEAAKKAFQLLHSMTNNREERQEACDKDEEATAVEPNVVSYNTVILAFANSGQPQHAQSLLRQMQTKSVEPDTISYNTVIYAWAKANNRFREAPQRAEAILREMMELHHEGNPHVKPDTVAFNSVLHAWSKSKQVHAAQRAEELLQHMVKLSQAGNQDVAPDVYSYTNVIRAWASSSARNASHRAKAILQMMDRESRMEGQEHLKPNTITYTSVMTALSKKGHAEEAQDLLDHLLELYIKSGDEELKPDVVSFSAVMDGWARSRLPQAWQRALELLERMKQISNEGLLEVHPNSWTYTSVISSLSSSLMWNCTDIAEQLLEEMEEAYKERQYQVTSSATASVVKPTTICYNAVLNCYARSRNMFKATKAAALLLRMQEDGRKEVKPDIVSYNSVLLACANSMGDAQLKKTAFEIALKTFQAVCRDPELKPSSVTFFVFFKCLRRLLKPGRRVRSKMIQQAFKLCCSFGLLNESVWNQVKAACSPQDLGALISTIPNTAALLEPEHIRASDFPKEWTQSSRRR